MSKSRKQKFMLLATLLMFAMSVVLLTRNEELIFRDEGRLVAERDPSDPGTVIFYWRNEVETPMARRFAEAFDEWRYEADRILIDLHSPGGAIREGGAVIRIIEEMKRTHIVDTRIRKRRACYSMCVPIFLQGEQRTASASSRFMFHEPTAYDFFTGEEVAEPEFEKRYASQRFVDRYFVNSPMNREWLQWLIENWRGKDVFKSGKDLMSEGSNIVTKLE